MIKRLKTVLIFVLVLCAAMFVGCGEQESAYGDEFDVYSGGEEFSFGKWASGVGEPVFTSVDVTEEGTVVEYNKYSGQDWPQIQTKIAGTLSGFKFVNFTIKASKAIQMEAQIIFLLDDSGEQTGQTSLIGEIPFDVSTTSATFSYHIPDGKRLMLDCLEDVFLFPEPGLSGAGYYGSFTIERSWFSKTLPSDALHVNENDSGEGGGVQETKIGQYWTNEASWTGYKVNLEENAEVRINFNPAATWGYLNRKLTDFDEQHNMLSFTFTNNYYGAFADTPSVEHIRFFLRGDRDSWVNDGTNSYWSYHEVSLDKYDYNIPREAGEIAIAPNAEQTVVINISAAYSQLKDHMTGGLFLKMFIESHPDESSKYDRRGNLTVKEVDTYYDENEPVEYNFSGYTTFDAYEIFSNAEATEMMVRWEGVPAANANITKSYTALSTEATYTLEVTNTSSHTIVLRLNYKKGDNGNYDNLAIELAAGASATLSVTCAVGADSVILFVDSVPADTIETDGSGIAGGSFTAVLVEFGE